MTFFLIFLFTFVISIHNLLAETVLLYEIFYGPIKLGESKIILSQTEFHAYAYTTGTGNILYPYQAKWQSIIDSSGYPKKSIIFSKDPFKEREKMLIFSSTNHQVQLKQLRPSPKEKIYPISFPLYDELTAFIASWYLNYELHSTYKLPLFIKGEKHFANLKFKKVVPCNFNQTSSYCLEIETILPEASELLKRSKELTILLHKEERIPVELRGSLPIFGSLTAKLKSYLKH